MVAVSYDNCYYPDLTTGNNITVTDQVFVDFFFGPQVLVDVILNYTREVNSQSIEIGIDCTVRDLPSLINGVPIAFEAYIETDDNITSQVETIYLQVSASCVPVLLLYA